VCAEGFEECVQRVLKSVCRGFLRVCAEGFEECVQRVLKSVCSRCGVYAT
jgi:hypothetical protein